MGPSAPSSNTNMPIGCIIMYHTNTGFTPDNAGVNGYYLNFGTECWKLCDGTTGSTLATGSAFGAVPDIINKFTRGINTTAPPVASPENISITTTLTMDTLQLNNLPSHTHDAPEGLAAKESLYCFSRFSSTPPATPIPDFPYSVVSSDSTGQYIQDLSSITGAIHGGSVPSVAPTGKATSEGSKINPASQDVLYIVRVH